MRAIYRKGRASHSDELRDARKVLFYARAEVKRLEALEKPAVTVNMSAPPSPGAVAQALGIGRRDILTFLELRTQFENSGPCQLVIAVRSQCFTQPAKLSERLAEIDIGMDSWSLEAGKGVVEINAHWPATST